MCFCIWKTEKIKETIPQSLRDSSLCYIRSQEKKNAENVENGTITLECDYNENMKNAKIFLWDSFNTLKPLSKPFEVKISE